MRWQSTARWTILLCMLLGAGPIVFGWLSLQTDSSGFIQWLPDGHRDRERYAWFVDHFGGDDILFVSWPGCTLQDERLDCLASALDPATTNAASPPTPSSTGSAPLIRQILTGPGVLEELLGEPLELSREEALRRLEGVLVGPRGSVTGLIIRPTEAGSNDQQALVDLVEQTAEASCGIDADALRMGGSIYDAVEIEFETERSLRFYAVPVLVVTVVLAAWCFRSIRLTAYVLFCAAYCRCLSLALVYYGGDFLTAVLIVMPVLIYVLCISGAVHLVNYYRDALQEGGIEGAAERALRAGWLPCTLAAATTAIGLSSLGVSRIPPVRAFGFYSALSLVLSIGILLLFLPSVLALWPVGQTGRGKGSARDESPPSRWDDLVESGAEFVIRRHVTVSIASLLLVTLAATGLLRTTTAVDLQRMFTADSKILRNYRWIEGHIAPLVAIEIIPRFESDSSLSLLEKMRLLRDAEDAVRAMDEVGGTLSTMTFLPPLPEERGLGAAVQRRVLAERVERQRDDLQEMGFLATENGAELWRISARVPATSRLDYDAVTNAIRSRIGQVVDAHAESTGETIDVTYTGLLPLIQRAQQLLLDDLIKSFLLALLLICPVMMLILRGFWPGILSMVPNTVPMLLAFGGMGWLQIPIDVGAMLTASVALGIAVDDTLHVLTWFARGLGRGLSRREAIRHAYRRCAVPMTQTTLICGLGLLPLAHSSFVPTSQFAWLILALLLAALVGDLLLLPALLAGPVGGVFARHFSPSGEAE